MRRLTITIALMALFGIVLSFLVQWPLSNSSGTADSQPNFLQLARPTLAQQASFLDQEAGFAAWAELGGGVDLELARRRFKTLDIEASDYLVGEVDVTSSGVTSGVHVYLSAAG